MLQTIIILALAGIGFGKILRSLPLADRVEAWLATTWTHGKPLACWSCLTFWGGLGAAALLCQGSICENVVCVVAATGLGATIMNKLDPLFVPPPVEMSDDLDPR